MPRAGHGARDLASVREVSCRMIDFFDRHIGDRKPTDPPDDCQFPGSKKLPYEYFEGKPMKLLRDSRRRARAAAVPAGAAAQDRFERPDCRRPQAAFKPEARCIRDIRKRWQEANFAALQKTGLMFIYMARPDVDEYPAAKEALEKKVEGSFTVRFSVAPDGTVYNVQATDVTGGIEPLARMWADTIGQWTFVKIDKAVTDVEHRRIYLYPKEDDVESQKKPEAAL